MRTRSGIGPILFLLYCLFGLYFLNLSLVFFKLPDLGGAVTFIINLIAGGLLIIGGINYLRARRRYYW